MTTATLRLSTPIAAAAGPAKKGLFTRFYNALIDARTRRAAREIAMYQHLLPENVRKDLGLLPFVRGT
jgi:hypothetical protein